METTLPLVEMRGGQIAIASNVSYGIAPILNTLVTLSLKSNRPMWSLYLVNVETLIRDRKEEVKASDNRARAVLFDMEMLSQYISAYCRLMPARYKIKKPILCFYFPHYDVIPKPYLREKLPSGTENRWKVRDAVLDIIAKEGAPQSYEDVNIVYDLVGTKLWPHKELVADLAKTTEGLPFRDTLMVSHVPSDFHLYRSFQKFTILESYTGALKQRVQLGKKVFQQDVFPFNKYLHLLLGDKWYLQPLIKTADKNRMKERAQREHWNILPDRSVLEALLSMNLVTSDLFIKPDM